MNGIRLYRDINYCYPNADFKYQYWWFDQNKRYFKISTKTLSDNYGLNDSISSLKIPIHSSNEQVTAILFEHPNCMGKFQAFSGDWKFRAIPDLNKYNFNDITSSVLVISHSDREFLPLRLGEIAGKDAEDVVDNALSSVSEASRRGDLTFTWALWPSYHPSKIFVRLDVPLNIHISAWPDYAAEIRYYVYFYIDSSDTLKGVAYYAETWVAGGIMAGSIMSRLKPEVVKAAGEINSYLNDTLDAYKSTKWESVYLMPGKAPMLRPADYSGTVTDDVSIILELK